MARHGGDQVTDEEEGQRAHLGGADDGAAGEEERHVGGEVEGAREPHPGRHVQQRATPRAAAALDARHGARERDRVERLPVPARAEAGHGHPRPAQRRRPRPTRILRPRRRRQQQQRRRDEQAQRRRHPSFLAQPRSGLAWLVAVAVKQGGWRRRAGEYKAQKLLRPCFGVDVNAVVVLPAAAIDKLTGSAMDPGSGWGPLCFEDGSGWSLARQRRQTKRAACVCELALAPWLV